MERRPSNLAAEYTQFHDICRLCIAIALELPYDSSAHAPAQDHVVEREDAVGYSPRDARL
jgi:hypothetical protein